MQEKIAVKKEYYSENDRHSEEAQQALREIEANLAEDKHYLQEAEDDLKFLKENEFSAENIKSSEAKAEEIRGIIGRLENQKKQFETILSRFKEADSKLTKILLKRRGNQPQ